MLAIITSTSVTKDWPLAEVNTALALDVAGDKTVVPLIVGKPDLSRLPLIRGRDYLVWSGDPQQVALKLREAVRRHTAHVSGFRSNQAGATTSSVPTVASTPRAPAAVAQVQPNTDPQPSWLRRMFRKNR